MNNFNLITCAWLPVRDPGGKRCILGLLDLFQQAGSLADLDLSPHERVSVMRLLICIAQAALGAPERAGDWEDFATGFEEKITDYLQKHGAGFELYGDGQRFLQAKPGKMGDPVSVSKLVPHLATGNNPTLFDHGGGTRRSLPSASLALALLTFQNFYPLYGAGYKGRGPCVDSNMLHTLVHGKNLRETIVRNCLDRQTLRHPQVGEFGRPVWEMFPKTHRDKPAVENATRTYLGRLVPLHRTVWLTRDGTGFFLSQEGWEYPVFDQYREPTATVIYNPNTGQNRLLWAGLQHSVWRELHVLTVPENGGKSPGANGPLVLRGNSLCGERSYRKISIWTGALVTDLKAKIVDSMEATFEVSARLFEDAGRKAYAEGVAYAQRCSQRLNNAVEAWGHAMKQERPPVDRAARYYWNALDQQSRYLLEVVRDADLAEIRFGGDSIDPWTCAVQAALRDAYDAVCPRVTPRQINAYTAGSRGLSPKPFRPKSAKPVKIRQLGAVA